MEIKLRWYYAECDFDTKSLVLKDIPARLAKHEKDAWIAIEARGNFQIMEVGLGDLESSNCLAAEIVRRWNEFPEELKR